MTPTRRPAAAALNGSVAATPAPATTSKDANGKPPTAAKRVGIDSFLLRRGCLPDGSVGVGGPDGAAGASLKTSKKTKGTSPSDERLDRTVDGASTASENTGSDGEEHGPRKRRRNLRGRPVGPSCATGVLRVASSSSSDKPTLHYWVEDLAVVGSASRYFRDNGYDVAQFISCKSRYLWNRTHGLDAPLQAEAIERDDGSVGSTRQEIAESASPPKSHPRPKGRARTDRSRTSPCRSETCWCGGCALTKRKRESAKSEHPAKAGRAVSGERRNTSVCARTESPALVDDRQVITADAATLLCDVIQKRDTEANPLQEHERLLFRSLILDENNHIRDCVTKILEEALKDRDMKAAPFQRNERRLLGQMAHKGFQTGEAGEKLKLLSFPNFRLLEIARVPTIYRGVHKNNCTNRLRKDHVAAARQWLAHLPEETQEDLVASITKEEEEEGPCKKQRIPMGKLMWDAEKKCFPDDGTDGVRDKGRYRCTWINLNGKGCNRNVRSFCACNPNRVLCNECIIKHRAYKMEDRERYGSSTKEDEEGGMCQKQWIPLGKLKWDADLKCFPNGTDGKDHQRFKWRYQCTWINLNSKPCGKKVRTFCA